MWLIGVIRQQVTWAESRTFFFWRLRRKLLEFEIANSLKPNPRYKIQVSRSYPILYITLPRLNLPLFKVPLSYDSIHRLTLLLRNISVFISAPAYSHLFFSFCLFLALSRALICMLINLYLYSDHSRHLDFVWFLFSLHYSHGAPAVGWRNRVFDALGEWFIETTGKPELLEDDKAVVCWMEEEKNKKALHAYVTSKRAAALASQLTEQLGELASLKTSAATLKSAVSSMSPSDKAKLLAALQSS